MNKKRFCERASQVGKQNSSSHISVSEIIPEKCLEISFLKLIDFNS